MEPEKRTGDPKSVPAGVISATRNRVSTVPTPYLLMTNPPG
jgi:hypothetical protein